jgi:hypothetical protein
MESRVLRATDLPALVESLKKAGLRFRNEMKSARQGTNSLGDPDGNPSICSNTRDSSSKVVVPPNLL